MRAEKVSAWGLQRLLASLLVILLVLPPLVGLLWSTVSGEGLRMPWPDARQMVILCRSLFLAGCAAVGACAIGSSLALILHSQSQFLQRLWWGLLLCLAALPPYLYALAWTEMMNPKGLLDCLSPIFGAPSGFGWCVFILILAYFPLAAILVWAGLNGLDADCLQAGRLAAGAGQYIRCILLPLVRPFILASLALVFLLVFLDYSVPSQLSVNTFPVEIFIAYSATLVPKGALRGLMPMLLLGPLMLWLYFVALRGRTQFQFRRPAQMLEGRRSAFLLPGVALVAALLLGLPLIQLIRSGWPPGRIWTTLVASRTAIGHSLLYAAAGGIMTIGVAVLLLPSPLHPNRNCRPPMWIRGLALLPVGLPGTAVGLGLIAVTQGLGWGAVARSSLPLMIGYVVMYLPFGWVILDAFIRQVPPEPLQASALTGQKPGRQWARIILPLWAPGLLCSFTVVVILILRELGVAVMLAAPGIESLALRIDSFIHYGAGGAVAGLSLFQAILTLALCASTAGLVRVISRART